MGKSAFDFDDIQALENRRKEIAVLAGASPRAERYRDSPLKKMIREYFEETKTKVEPKFREYAESHPLPYYNFVSSANPVDDENNKDYEKQQKEAKEAADKQQEMMEEANENEYKVTDTSTGLPKAEPVLDEEEQELQDKRKKRALALRQKEATVKPTTVLHTSPTTPKTEDKSDKK